MVTDHRTDVSVGDTQAVLNGEIGVFIDAYLKSQMGQVSLILLASALICPLWIASASAESPTTVSRRVVDGNIRLPERHDFRAFSFGSERRSQKVDLVYQEASLRNAGATARRLPQADDRLTATAKADIATYFVPAGIDLTYHWVVTFARRLRVRKPDTSVVTWIDNRFDVGQREGTGVEVYSYDRSDKFMDFVMETANKAVQDMIALYNPPKCCRSASGSTSRGRTSPARRRRTARNGLPAPPIRALQVILAVIPKNRSRRSTASSRTRSATRFFPGDLNPYNAPATWIDEGLAVVAQIGGKDHYERRSSATPTTMDDLLSLRSLISSFPYDPSQASLAYGESYLVMQFILDQYGPEAIQANHCRISRRQQPGRRDPESARHGIEELGAGLVASQFGNSRI